MKRISVRERRRERERLAVSCQSVFLVENCSTDVSEQCGCSVCSQLSKRCYLANWESDTGRACGLRVRETSAHNVGEQKRQKNKKARSQRRRKRWRRTPCHCWKWLEKPSGLQILSRCTETDINRRWENSQRQRGCTLIHSADGSWRVVLGWAIYMNVNLWHSRRENPGFLLWVQSHVGLIGHGRESVPLYLPQRGRIWWWRNMGGGERGIEMRGKEKSTDLVHYTAKNTLWR